MRYKDQLGRELVIKKPIRRIVSIVPSQTELLVDLGLRKELVGITKFCVHPLGLRKEKTVIGGTKQIDLEKIKTLDPDIVLCNKEENTNDMVVSIEKAGIPVHVSDVKTFGDALGLIKTYGKLFDKVPEANSLVKNVDNRYQDFKSKLRSIEKKKVLYLIWKNPLMTIGQDTFIHQMLELNGLENMYKSRSRYPEVEIDIVNRSTEDFLVFLSSEPFPFSSKHLDEFSKLFPSGKVILVDGEYFSWYGSRLVKAFDYFYELQDVLQSK